MLVDGPGRTGAEQIAANALLLEEFLAREARGRQAR
jgi:hypothetical protein